VRPIRRLIPLCLAALVSACAADGVATRAPGEIHDPLEDGNRRVHAFNKAVALAVTPENAGDRPPSEAARVVRRGVRNFASNLGGPSDVLNSLLQGRIEDAGHTAFRFAVNTTLGFAGLLDPASDMGLDRRETDFGETLFVWGVGEGAYLELPLYGPSTQRDFSGEVVDLFLNPLTVVTLSPPESFIPPTFFIAEVTDFRFEFTDSIDQVLYESADSYAQSRLVYLENRRFELGDTESAGGIIDPFEEFDAQ